MNPWFSQSGKRIKILILMLLTGILIWRIEIARRDLAISVLYVSKNPCEYKPSKRSVIFLDDRAQKALLELKITPEEILKETNRIFSEHRLPMRYDIRSMKLRAWNTETGDCKFIDNRFLDENKCFSREMAPKAGNLRTLYDPDQFIFLTATGIDYMSGRSLNVSAHGNGTIILNLGLNQKKYDSDERVRRVARKFFMRRFAHLVIHEYSHLYDAEHSDEPYSIMNSNLSDLGSHRVKLDPVSRKKLMAEYGKLMKNLTKSCAAAK